MSSWTLRFIIWNMECSQRTVNKTQDPSKIIEFLAVKSSFFKNYLWPWFCWIRRRWCQRSENHFIFHSISVIFRRIHERLNMKCGVERRLCRLIRLSWILRMFSSFLTHPTVRKVTTFHLLRTRSSVKWVSFAALLETRQKIPLQNGDKLYWTPRRYQHRRQREKVNLELEKLSVFNPLNI